MRVLPPRRWRPSLLLAILVVTILLYQMRLIVNLPPTVYQTDEDSLAIILEKKLADFPQEESILPKQNCNEGKEASFVCMEPTCQFHPSPKVRLKQILNTRSDSINAFLAAMAESARDIATHRRIILVTAVDSSYFLQLQTVVRNLIDNVFPKLQNFSFVVYDLGMTEEERISTKKNCRCTLLRFPFRELPSFVRNLRCYAWKPPIVRTLIDKADIVVWLDSSVQWDHDAPLQEIFSRTTERGLQLSIDQSGSIAVRTGEQTFRYYGDDSCMYEAHGEVYGTMGIFHNERFVREAVLDPWVSCAFNLNCMCFGGSSDMLHCAHKLPRKRSACHRFDQSSLGIIVSKLYNERTNLFRIPGGYQIKRGETSEWFE